MRESLLKNKPAAEIEAYNEERANWRPDPGSESAEFFGELRRTVAPDRQDIKTWFDVLDLDEKRTVTNAHA